MLADVTGTPLEEGLGDFWSPGLSQARLRALPPTPATPPDLLLKVAARPDLTIRGTGLRDLLTPAYTQLAAPKPALPHQRKQTRDRCGRSSAVPVGPPLSIMIWRDAHREMVKTEISDLSIPGERGLTGIREPLRL